MKKVGIIKRVSAIGLIFLLSINSFAAIVSDNDGSAFVTKAEFDALKNGFAKQIDDYNTSIDGKIDGAIAAYLSGLEINKVNNLAPIVSHVEKIYCVDEDRIKTDWDWKGGQTFIKERINWIVCGDASRQGGWLLFSRQTPDKTNFTKLVIEEKQDKDGNLTPYWWGYTTGATESIDSMVTMAEIPGGFTKAGYGGNLYLGGFRNVAADGDLGKGKFTTTSLITSAYSSSSFSGGLRYEMPSSTQPSCSYMNTPTFEWGEQERQYIITYHDASSHFSVKDDDRYWRNKSTDPDDTMVKKSGQLASVAFEAAWIEGGSYTSTVKRCTDGFPTGGAATGEVKTDDATNRICFGFHPTYKKFSQLVCEDYSDIIVSLEDKSESLGKIHPYAGWPMCVAAKNHKVTIPIVFEDKTKDYLITASKTQFSLTDSGDITGNIKISLKGGAPDYVIKIDKGMGTIEYTNTDDSHILWLKWTDASTKKGGGVLLMPNDMTEVKID